MTERLLSKPSLSDAKTTQALSRMTDKINEIALASQGNKYVQIPFPGVSRSETKSTEAVTVSTVFGSILTSGYSYARLGGMLKGWTKYYGYNGQTPISGLQVAHYSGDTGTTMGDWVAISSDEKTINLYGQSSGVFFNFDDNDITSWTTIRGGVALSFSASSGKVNCINTSTNKYNGVLYAAADYNAAAPIIQCEVKLKDNNPSYYGGLAYNITDISNFNFVRIGTTGGHIGKVLSGVMSGQAAWTQTLTYNNYYTLKVEVSETGVVDAYVDDVLKQTYNYGSAFTEKPIGLYYYNDVATANLDVDYDDFVAGAGGTIYSPFLMLK